MNLNIKGQLPNFSNKKSLIITSLIIFYACFGNFLFGQDNDIVFEHINTSDGLSNNTTRIIHQDNKGYMWIGTTDGLNKYDGYNFTLFRYDPQDTNSISNNSIWAILEDKSDKLWFGTENGLNVYNRDKESFKTYRYTNTAGRWSNAVTSLFEDDGGNIWFGTVFSGLSKFDTQTKKFAHYLPDTANTEGGLSNGVIWILKDSIDKNRFWLGLWQSGFYSFDINSETFTKHKHDPKKPGSLANDNIRSLYQDKKGNVWIGTQGGGLDMFDPKTEQFIHYRNNPKNNNSISNNNVLTIFETHEEKEILWIGTEGGLDKFNINAGTFSHYKSDVNDKTTLSNNTVLNIYDDRSGVRWIGTNGGLNKIDPGRVPFRHQNSVAENPGGLNSNRVYAILKSTIEDDILWIGTYDGGLNRYNRNTNSYTYFKRQPVNTAITNSDSIRALYEDPDEAGEVLWVGTANKGLNRYDIKKNSYKNYHYIAGDPTSISSNLVRQIYETRDGALWLATPAGLNKFDRKKELFTRFLPQDTTYISVIQNLLTDFTTTKKPLADILRVKDFEDRTQTFVLNSKTNVVIIGLGEGFGGLWDYGWLESAAGNEIWKMKLSESRHAGGGDKNRMQIWTGTLDPGSYNLRYKSDDSHSYGSWNAPEPINPNMWGIQIFEINDTENKLIAQNIHKIEKPNSIVGDNISAIVEDSYGMLWIATQDRGLSKLDRKTGVFTNFIYDPVNPLSINSNIIFSLHEDKKGTLWIGTRDGLNKYDSKNNSFSSYTVKEGLPNNAIISIVEDAYGSLWLATNNGICKFNPNEKSEGHLTFINYNIPDGLEFNNYYYGASYRSANGEMFFGGSAGFVSFYPGKSNPLPPRTLLSDFRIFNQSIQPGKDTPLKKHISETESISLSYDQNAFSFEFVALHYSQPTKNKYLYKMEGFDKDWIDGYRRYAPYTNLDPGNYSFYVKASNSDGVWNEEGTSVKVIILPPWWRTYWAYTGYVLFLISLVIGLDRFQRKRLLAKTKERMKMQAAEHRAESAELEARAARAENERKTKELEEARDLQLSMLPKELPQLPHLDIAVYMQTATEVGGDYYDFHVALDGTLTVVIGDATGHGMRAGTMVTTAKSLFNSYAPNPDILYSFSEITRCIKQMNFGKLSMCMTMVKINGTKMQMSTAGMPPSLIFRRDTRVVEEHLFKAMPLGTMDKFPYELKDTTLKPGDTILLMSDGLPELENQDGQMYGYKKIRNSFEDVAEQSPEKIISHLKNEGVSWANNEDPDDDVTFVVIKMK